MKRALLLTLLFAFASASLAAEKPLRVLFLIGEDSYGTAASLPAFAKAELDPQGIQSTFVVADKSDPNAFPGLEALKDADVLFLSVRRRTPSTEQMALIKAHLAAGKGLVAIRTASHAFALRQGEAPAGHVQWPEFDREILGHTYEGDYNNKDGTDISTLPHAIIEPLMAGIKVTSFHSQGSLYQAHNLASNCKVLLRGVTTAGGEPRLEPVAWSRTAGKSRVFYTSMGHAGDFELAPFRRLLVNAVYWSGGRDIPGADADSLQQRSAERDKRNLGAAGNEQVAEIMQKFAGKGEIGDFSTPTPPEEAVKKFQVNEEFKMELIASEPTIEQPLYINWDERGRMWVVQYRQYPFPAGLKVIKYDQYLRAVFDKVPPPPPNHFVGKDKITVLEDTDGDGTYDKAKDVITGLNIATSVCTGHGGIWVLNPPYLLFYPDADRDDVPDANPEVCLSGFGLEDTHSVANSLRWGPDGWLYGANGSTTTATINSAATKNVQYKGQCVWRYHPDTKVFEIFAEGGGNTFSTEIDSVGRMYSGTNNGNTRGMHYVQGGYAEKNWGKHGPLTNPYAFGFYEHMRHEGFNERFSQAFAIYEGGAFPPKYNHAVIAANSLHNRVLASELLPDTSTWRTVDMPPLVLTTDRWFRPVDLKIGPDGAAYLADWYDSRLTHVDPRDNWHKTSGRIYRLKAKDAPAQAPINLLEKSTPELVRLLTTHPNKRIRFDALRVLDDRNDTSVLPGLRQLVLKDADQGALEALWAVNLLGGFDDEMALAALDSKSPHLRRWAARLTGDSHQASAGVAARLQELAISEPDAEVRSQLASSAKRLPAAIALPMIRELANHSSDLEDLHIPLLIWWALESKCEGDRDAVLGLFQSKDFWSVPIVEQFLVERLMRRFAMAGSPEDLRTCARLLELAPDESATRRLMSGLLQAFEGRQIKDLPPALAKALDEYQKGLGETGVAIGLRRGDDKAVSEAIKVIGDAKADMSTRLAYIEILGQVNQPKAIPTLTRLLRTTGATAINLAALKALQAYPDPAIGRAILGAYHSTLLDENGVRATANRVLASRKEWALDFLHEVDQWFIKADTISFDVVQQLALHNDPEINRLVEKHWGKVRGTSPEDKQKQIAKLEHLLTSRRGQGNPAKGQEYFTQMCAVCHTLFGAGGKVGPELTGYERDNLDFLLPAVVDPSLAIREEFTAFNIETTDGRQLSGLIEQQDPQKVVLRGVDGQSSIIARDQIKSLQASRTSLMPEGLTEPLTDDMLLDLFAYVTSRAPTQSLK